MQTRPPSFSLLSRALLLLLCVLPLTARADPFPFRLQYLTTDDGLAQNTVDAMLRDSEGFLWFATWNGLDRYDGYDFRHYRSQPGAQNGLPDNGIHTLAEDRNRNLWVGTAKGLAVFSLDRERFLVIDDAANVLTGANITAIHPASSEGAWIATRNSGLYLVTVTEKEGDTRELVVRRHYTVPQAAVTSLAAAGGDSLLVGTTQGIYSVTEHRARLRRLAGPRGQLPVTTLYTDETGLWAGSMNGLYHFGRDAADGRHYLHETQDSRSLLHNTVTAIRRDAEGTLLVGTLGGISLFAPLTDDFQSLTQGGSGAHQLNNRFVNSLLTDTLGNVWIGTEKGGVNKYNLHQHRFGAFTHDARRPNALSHPTVNSILEEGETLWVGTAGGGLNQVDRTSGRVVQYAHDPARAGTISSDYVTSILRGADHNLWLGTWGSGLNRMDTRTGRFAQFTGGPAGRTDGPVRFISSLQADPRGFMLIGSEEGLSVYDPAADSLRTFHAPHPLSVIREVGCILLDSRDVYWIGTRNGLFQLPAAALSATMGSVRAEDILHFTEDAGVGLPGNYILSLREDQRGRVWIGTYGRGIAVTPTDYRSAPAFTSYDERHGLGNNVVYSIEVDERGQLWLGTDHGLTSFNPRTNTFRNYHRADGLLSNQFYWSASHRGAEGVLYFGSVAGINYFRPSALGDYPDPAPAVFTALEILNQPVTVGQELHGTTPLGASISRAESVELSYRDNVFSIHFSALDYFLPGQTQFAYRMVGVDKDWVRVGADRRFASYTNLEGGDYTFEVKASNGHGAWQRSPTRLQVVILPPFYQTAWFRALACVLLVGAVGLYMRWRFHFLRAQTKKLEGLVSTRTAQIERQKEDLHGKNLILAQRRKEIAEQKDELEVKNREISQQRDRLIELNQRVREVNQMRLRFFTNISHEFRTPLTLVLDPLEDLLERYKDNAEVCRSLEIVNRNAQRLLGLINQLMHFRRIEEGQQRVRAAPGDAARFTKEIFYSFRELARHRAIDYRFVLSNPRRQTYFDAEKLEHILYNLLSNALKFTPPGGRVSLEMQFTEEPGNRVGSFMEIRVRDTGVGVPAAEQELIFDHFYQADNHSRQVVGGSGIGLSLVRELVQLLHGTITLTSESGKGSVFTVRLPYRRESFAAGEIVDPPAGAPVAPPRLTLAAEAVHQPLSELPEASATEVPEAPRILVVEDNRDLRHLLVQRLGRHYRVLAAENGREGLQLAREHSPDLVISDVMMPVMDGMELCMQLKSDIETSHLPVILLTAKTMVESWVEGLDKGADDYVAKPFNLRILVARIDNLIRSRQRLRRLFGKQAAPVAEVATSNPVDQQFLKKLYAVLEENYATPEFTQDQLAAELCISRSLLYKKVKSLTDRTVTDFVNFYKVDKATQLLATNALSVAEVAYRAGFSDPKYFSRIFKKTYGYPPSEFYTRHAGVDLNNPN